jgi:hypothetical protein
MEQTECSETLACKIQTPGNYPEESIQHLQQGESLKSKFVNFILHGETLQLNVSSLLDYQPLCIFSTTAFINRLEIIQTDVPLQI